MAQTLKVFKNVNTQTAVGAAQSITLASTGSTEQAVIKDINCNGLGGIATLDLDGRTVLSSTVDSPEIKASGNLAMDSSSVLSLKFPAIAAAQSPSFRGMFFSSGNDGCNTLIGDGIGSGITTSMTSITNHEQGGHSSNSACSAYKSGVLTHFKRSSNQVYEHTTSNTVIAQYSFGSGYGLATDGTYLYNVPSNTTTTIHRRHIVNGTVDTLTAASTIKGQAHNVGAYLEYHKGYLLTKFEGADSTMYMVNLSTMAVTNITNANVPGSYSDGSAVVTTRAGVPYIVEQGTNGWMYYELHPDGGPSSTTTFTQMGGSSNASTEYGNGGAEVAPGIAYIFCEASDDLTVIDMNESPITSAAWAHYNDASAGGRNAAVSDAYSNQFSFTGMLEREVKAVEYNAYVSGVLVTTGI
jgi:hypothetical protein